MRRVVKAKQACSDGWSARRCAWLLGRALKMPHVRPGQKSPGGESRHHPLTHLLRACFCDQHDEQHDPTVFVQPSSHVSLTHLLSTSDSTNPTNISIALITAPYSTTATSIEHRPAPGQGKLAFHHVKRNPVQLASPARAQATPTCLAFKTVRTQSERKGVSRTLSQPK